MALNIGVNTAAMTKFKMTVYTVILNLVVAAALTPVFNAMGSKGAPADETLASDYVV